MGSDILKGVPIYVSEWGFGSVTFASSSCGMNKMTTWQEDDNKEVQKLGSLYMLIYECHSMISQSLSPFQYSRLKCAHALDAIYTTKSPTPKSSTLISSQVVSENAIPKRHAM